jgi:hypothetical protein
MDAQGKEESFRTLHHESLTAFQPTAQMESWGNKRWCTLPKVLQLLSDRLEVLTQPF